MQSDPDSDIKVKHLKNLLKEAHETIKIQQKELRVLKNTLSNSPFQSKLTNEDTPSHSFISSTDTNLHQSLTDRARTIISLTTTIKQLQEENSKLRDQNIALQHENRNKVVEMNKLKMNHGTVEIMNSPILSNFGDKNGDSVEMKQGSNILKTTSPRQEKDDEMDSFSHNMSSVDLKMSLNTNKIVCDPTIYRSDSKQILDYHNTPSGVHSSQYSITNQKLGRLGKRFSSSQDDLVMTREMFEKQLNEREKELEELKQSIQLMSQGTKRESQPIIITDVNT